MPNSFGLNISKARVHNIWYLVSGTWIAPTSQLEASPKFLPRSTEQTIKQSHSSHHSLLSNIYEFPTYCYHHQNPHTLLISRLMESPLTALWDSSVGNPFLPAVGKNSQFFVGFTLLSLGLLLTGFFGLSMLFLPSKKTRSGTL